jgi:hypothetical protein
MAEHRASRDTGFHRFWAALVVALTVGAASVPRVPLAVVLGALGLACAAAWSWLSGWRTRSPFYLLPERREPSPDELMQRDSARRVRDELIQLLHSCARPATAKLREVTEVSVTDLKERSDPYSQPLDCWHPSMSLQDSAKQRTRFALLLRGFSGTPKREGRHSVLT